MSSRRASYAQTVSLIAEDLLLLLLDDESGKPQTSQLRLALGGAVLVELAITGAVTIEEKSSMWRSAKVRLVEGAAPDDPVLRDGLARVAEKERSAESLVDRLGKGLAETLGDRLVERGILERREHRLLGLVPRTRWPARDSAHEEDVRRALTVVLVGGAEPEPRTGALVSLLYAVDRAHKTVPHEGLSKGEVRKRAKQVAEGQWAAAAVNNAIAAVTAATTAAIAATSAAAMSSGS